MKAMFMKQLKIFGQTIQVKTTSSSTKRNINNTRADTLSLNFDKSGMEIPQDFYTAFIGFFTAKDSANRMQ